MFVIYLMVVYIFEDIFFMFCLFGLRKQRIQDYDVDLGKEKVVCIKFLVKVQEYGLSDINEVLKYM